jgi:peptidoglycan/LPS O-acetylase OafA/YrhL
MSRRIPGLDGLRAFSAVGVALMHIYVLPIGWIGVQVFYVLSGFLITGILIEAKDNSPSLGALLKRFYYRRSLRILPLYFTYLLFILAASYLFHSAIDQRRALPWLATYTYNIHRVLHPSDRFGLSTHLWSLCIEEQFYLAWPLFVFFLSGKHFRIFAIAVIVLSPFLRASLLLTSRNPTLAAYFLTPYQLDGFAVGAVLSTFSVSQLAALRKPLSAILACTIPFALIWNRHQPWFGLMWLMHEGHGTWIWGYTLINLCAAALVIACICGSPLIPFLEWSPLRYLGRISYGFYVWHAASVILFVHIFHHLHLTNWLSPFGLSLLITFLAFNTLISALSFRFLEQPPMRFRDRFFPEEAKTSDVQPQVATAAPPLADF